ncbi:hypothetical protein P12x_000311 [Tundrisphaera lichenicola]|uniref:hypothetical protein n=1 Tax=Tundrisphaera lichenicola TaxID=2029860 RepID=UPI003EBFC550
MRCSTRWWAGAGYAPREGWEAEDDRLHDRHLASLGEFDYLKGQQRLKNLESWACCLIEQTRDEADQPVLSPGVTLSR